MSFNSSLNNWEKDVPAALDLKNVSNSERDEDMHKWLRDIYLSPNPKPALNLEPFYPGWTLSSGNEIEPGLNDVSMAQMQMYGSVLSGGLAGHAWGDAWYAGAASSTNRPNGATNVPADDPKINAISAFESQAMGHLKSFILDSGHEYRRLIPAADTNLSDSKKFLHTLSISEDKSFALGFFTATTSPNPDPLPELTNLIPLENYLFEWWDITNGSWIREGYIVASDSGQLVLPSLPNDNDRSISWAYRIRSKKYVDEVEVTIDEPVEEPVIPADPINTGPIVPDPIDPDPIIPDVIDPNPIDADPVVQDPIETDPINPDPIDADPVNEPSEDANNDDLVSDEPDVTVDPVDEPEAEPIDPSPVSDAPVDENNDNSGDPDPVSEPISSPNSENIIAYPNATTDSFWITGLSAGAKEIKVMDLSGQLLIQERIDGNEPTLDLSNYPTGVYIVEVVQKGLKKTIKVVKE
ncbi:MAG TPA: T9SS type A sorting domain-containing protein [Pricia sp.]|nr:T9SS type A sorting domain-containing protein [Pricia sp.]